MNENQCQYCVHKGILKNCELCKQEFEEAYQKLKEAEENE